MGAGVINFGAGQASGDASLAGAPPLSVNVVVDGAGAVRRRPGLSAWSGFPSTIPVASQVIGIHAFEGAIIYVNALRQIHRVYGGVNLALSDATSSTQLAGSASPSFAVTPYRLVIAGGGDPEQVESGATMASRLGGSPPDSTSVAFLASRLFSDDDTSAATLGHIRFSGVGATDEESWDELDFGAAEADPDDIVAIKSTANELWAFGAQSLQVFSPDPINILASGRALPVGCLAARSIIRVDDSFAWLDDQRRIVMSDGRDYNEISGTIAATLDDITTVSDCFGYRVSMGQFDCLVWTFPSDGRSFVFQRGGGWGIWQGWTQGVGHTLLAPRSHFFWDAQNVHLAGLSTGQIAKFDSAAYTDLGGIIKAEVWTGFESRGTSAPKQCECVRFIVKRGTSSVPAPALLYSWRDNDGDAFCDPIRIDMGSTGDYVSAVEVRGLGVYRQRQHKIEMTEAADLTLARVEEEWSDGG